ncbi:MAG: hypothetical protein WCS09_02980 [Pseudomonadota bacterium]|jgi:hypothetical protein
MHDFAMPTRDYPLKIAVYQTPTLDIVYSQGHHEFDVFEKRVHDTCELEGDDWVEPQHGWWRLLRGWQPSAAAPGTQGAFPVTWMERRRC